VVDVDEVLSLFGTTRRSARAAYLRQLKWAVNDAWMGEGPGNLPWWRLGRHRADEDEDPEKAIRERRARAELGPHWRPEVAAVDFVTRGALLLDVDLDALRSRQRNGRLARARELLGVLGVERYGLKVKDLAREVNKSPDGMTQAIARATRRGANDSAFVKDLNRLDRQLAGVHHDQTTTE
jgi:hypothetical protein